MKSNKNYSDTYNPKRADHVQDEVARLSLQVKAELDHRVGNRNVGGIE